MPYPTLHTYMVIGGIFTDTSETGEIWQFGIRGRVSYAGSDTNAILVAVYGPRVKTWFGGASNRMRSDAQLQFVKFNDIGPSGKYVNPSFPNTWYGVQAGGAAAQLPSMCTVAWSFTTNRIRGVGAHGRIYPPNTLGTYATGSSRITTGEANAQAAACKALIDTLVASAGAGSVFTPQVVSNTPTGGLQTDINGIKVGDVIDVQRRRKDRLKENYVTSSL